MSDKKSLIQKLADACDAVGGVEKKGKNEKQNYKYLKAADVAKAIRHELFSRGIVIMFDEKEFTQLRSIKTNSGGEMGEFMLRSEVTFLDGESSEKLGPFGAYGVAMDTGDKAIWKAKTGALKYVLRGIGLIPDEKDDPEADKKVDEALDGATFEHEFDKRTEGQRRVSDYQVRAWESGVTQGVRSQTQVAAYFHKLGIKSVAEMQKSDFNEAIKWLLNPKIEADLTQTLKESVEAVKTNGNGKKPALNFPKLFAEARDRGIPEGDVKQYAYETFKIETLNDLSPFQFKQLQEWIGLMA